MRLDIISQKEWGGLLTLLVVDDEFYTRRGIIEFLPPKLLSIMEVMEACDGHDALVKIEKAHVDIVISDIRMTKMDGIEMGVELRKRYPECVIIYMSGYTDREYIRSAMHIGAVRFIDKPIIAEELIGALEYAVEICSSKLQSSLASIKDELSNILLKKNANDGKVNELLGKANYYKYRNASCLTSIIQFSLNRELDDEDNNGWKQEIATILKDVLEQSGMVYLYCFKRNQNLILHLTQKNNASKQDFENNVRGVMGRIAERLHPHQFFIAIGVRVKNIYQIYKSYHTAVLTLQRSFFMGVNSIASYRGNAGEVYTPDASLPERFAESLYNNDKDEASKIIRELALAYRKHTGTLASQIKNTFFNLISKLLLIADKKYLNIVLDGEKYVWEIITNINCLDELEDFTTDCINAYFEAANKTDGDHNVDIITSHIEKGYSNPDFTINLLSERLGLTSSYLCFVFKQKKGMTINQYLTRCRMDRAKEFLHDKKFKVSEIGKKCGYLDSGYFAKVFKKQVGMSPNEYREGGFL